MRNAEKKEKENIYATYEVETVTPELGFSAIIGSVQWQSCFVHLFIMCKPLSFKTDTCQRENMLVLFLN